MNTKSDVPKESKTEGNGRMRNESGTLRTSTRVIKKLNQYEVIQIKLNVWKLKREMLGVT